MVITDEFSKFVILKALENPDAIQAAEVLYNDVIPYFGIPRVMHSDKGTAFTANIARKLCEMLAIDQTYAPKHHHQSMGQVERNVRTVREITMPLVEEHGQDWEQVLPGVAMVINTSPHSITKLAPFSVLYGRLPYHPDEEYIENMQIENVSPEAEVYLTRLKARLLEITQKLKERIKAYQEATYSSEVKTVKTCPYAQIGEYVLVKNHAATRKDQKSYVGPLKVDAHLGDNIVSLVWVKNGRRYTPREVHLDDLKPCFGILAREEENEEEQNVEYEQTEFESEENESQVELERPKLTEPSVEAQEIGPEKFEEISTTPSARTIEVGTIPVRRSARIAGQVQKPLYVEVPTENEELDEKCRPPEEPTTDGKGTPRQGPSDVEPDDIEYRVKRILARRKAKNRGRMEFKVQFVGYSPKEAMWLPAECLNPKAMKAAEKAPIVD